MVAICEQLTQDGCVETVKVRNQNRRGQHEQEQVAKDEIRAPQRQFDDLDQKFSRRLRHEVCTQPSAIPPTSPPCAVCLVVFEFT